MAIKSLTLQAGERTSVVGKPVSNKILLSVPDDEYRAIRPGLEYLDLPSHFTLHEPSEKLECVYFLNGGLVSLVVPMRDGKTVEAGVVGNEGVAGVPIIVGLTRSPVREIVQISGDGFRLRSTAMHNIFKSIPEFHMTLTRYAVVQGMQVAQTVACNRLHSIEQRLARWLLMAQDRVNSGSVAMTHDFLATMLGTNRPTVTSAAAILQKRKAIEYTRGGVRIVSRRKLETCACECYGVIQQFNSELGLR
jgi:CRP-like cAMP-binding protein